MDLNKLLIFSKVAENQSFTNAAKELGIEKSTVSSKISQLEDHLGARLLNRTTRTVTLTEAGAGYYAYCQQIVKNAIEADEFVRTFNDEPQGLLRISAPEGVMNTLFDGLTNAFLTQYDNMAMDIYITDRKVDLVRERFDIVLRASATPLKDSSLIAKAIQEIELGFFVAPHYLQTHGKIQTIAQLEQQPFIHFIPEDRLNLQLGKNSKKFTPKLNKRMLVNDTSVCISAVLAGLGVGILPIYAVKDELINKNLVQIMPEYKLPAAHLYAIYPSRHWLPAKIKNFLAFIEQWSARQSQ